MIEATPTFALPTQFLVWIAEKVLAQPDLDLVLTEYYKDGLESRLNNRQIPTNGLILTELTNSTGLQIPSNWKPCTKPSTGPFLSPQSLPFLLYICLPTLHLYLLLHLLLLLPSSNLIIIRPLCAAPVPGHYWYQR